MLGDIEPYRDWLNRETPSELATKVAAEFIAEIATISWAAPSIPFDTGGQPRSEVRAANMPVPGEPDVRIRYRRIYATERVDLLDLTNQRTRP